MPEGIRGRPYVVSTFHCREMLYDYMTGRLDNQRREAVERMLKEDKGLKAELDAYIDAAHYCTALAQVQLSDAAVADLENIRLQSEIVADKVRYRNWPDLLKWSSEAVVISVFVAGLAMVIPWSSIRGTFKNPPHNEIILADVEKVPEQPTAIEPKVEAKPETKSEPKHEAKPEPVKVEPVAVVAPPPLVAAASPAPVPATAPVVPVETKLPPPKPVEPTKLAEVPKPRLAVTEPKPAAKPPATQGMLYRIMMNKTDIEKLAPELRDKIVALGGKKAGEVEIGWRQPGQNYFHFSLPESNYQQLLSILASMGPSRIYKSPHPRIMPDGVMRIILTIKDGPPQKAVTTGSAFGEDGATETAEPNAPTEEAVPADTNSTENEQ